MSRFADPTKVHTVPLGPCQCPGTPHEQDEWVCRWDLSGSALARIGAAELSRIAGDPFVAWRVLVFECSVSWNLLAERPPDEKGHREVVPVPITMVTIGELDEPTLQTMATAADDLIGSKGTLPNASGDPSVGSPQESASPTPKSTQTPGT